MTFVNPAFLWALALLAIPVIIHLFNFRRYKKVYFTNVKFLKSIDIEQKTRNRLKEWLILFCRLVAISALVLAFAQPYQPSQQSAGIGTISAIYIDNSFSMNRVNNFGPLFDIAKERAREIIQRSPNGHKFYLITNAFEGKHQRLYSKEDALSELDRIKINSAPKALHRVVDRMQEFLRGQPYETRQAWLISDLQKNTFNLAKCTPDTSIQFNILPLSVGTAGNVYIDSCWFSSPIQQTGFIQTLHARLINTGDQSIESGSAKLIINGRQTAINSYTLAAHGVEEILFSFELNSPEPVYGEVVIEDFPVTHDDVFYFAYQPGAKIPVTIISPPELGDNFKQLYGNDSLFTTFFFNPKAIDYGKIRQSRLIVLNQLTEVGSGLLNEIDLCRKNGAVLVFIPSLPMNAANQNIQQFFKLPILQNIDTTQLRGDIIEEKSPFFDGVFEKLEPRVNLPQVQKHYKIQPASNSEVLIKLANGDALFTKYNFEAPIYMFTTGFEKNQSNFSRHALFVPVFYKMAFSSMQLRPLFYTTGIASMIELNQINKSEQPPSITSLNSTVEIIPEVQASGNNVRVNTRGQIEIPGYYKLSQNKLNLLPLAYNFSRTESVMDSYSREDIQAIIDEKRFSKVFIGQTADEAIPDEWNVGNEGEKFWKLFLLLALAGLLAEMALIRLLK